MVLITDHGGACRHWLHTHAPTIILEQVFPLYRPQLATLARTPPTDDPSLGAELKHDGWRAAAVLRPGRHPRLESRHNTDLTARFPDVVIALKRLRVESALLDGELAVLMPDGRTNFEALQRRDFGHGRLVYYAFDLIHQNGEDVARRPLAERKAILEALVASEAADGVIRYTSHIIGDAPRVLARACELGAEGVICKRLDAPYRSGRSRDWLKYKCLHKEPFVVGGFTAGTNSVSALLVGYHDAAGALRYAGNIGAGKGFTREFMRELYAQLVALEQARSPFAGFEPTTVRTQWTKARGVRPRWVKPLAVIDVAFLEITEGGQLRHASFQGFRQDLAARDVVRAGPR